MTPPKATTACELEFTATLLEKASAREKVIDGEGHMRPVLSMLVELDGPTKAHALLEQPFPPGQMQQCEAAARRYRAGARVTVQASTLGVRYVVPNVLHVHVQSQEPTDTPASAVPA